MKKIIPLIFLALITLNANSQDDKWFISAGLDPTILSGLNNLDGTKRVGAGGLDFMLQVGREGYSEKVVKGKFGIQIESFKTINYFSGGFFGGVTYNAPKIPGTNLHIGHFWYTTLEINLISRKGIPDTIVYNPNSNIDWSLGINMGIKIQKIFKTPFDLDLILNGKDRTDIKTHYGSTGFKDTFIISSYVLLTLPF